MRPKHAVEVDRLHVVRGGHVALERVTLDVRRGTVTGLLGPSGSAKSTLLRAIVGVQLVDRAG
jgi:ABC-2 type transport system ATP-binding protein